MEGRPEVPDGGGAEATGPSTERQPAREPPGALRLNKLLAHLRPEKLRANLHPIERDRLKAQLAAFTRQLEWREKEDCARGGSWLPIAKTLLCDAKKALADGELEKAWLCQLMAARLEIFGYRTEELTDARIALRNESNEKLESWRQRTVSQVLARAQNLDDVVDDIVGHEATATAIKKELHDGPKEGARDSIAQLLRARGADHAGADYAGAVAALLTGIAEDSLIRPDKDGDAERQALFQATFIRDEHSGNVYRRLALLRQQRNVLSWVLIVALADVLVLAVWKPIDLNGDPAGPRAWAWAFLFGTLGGCMTALLSMRQARRTRIPEQLEQRLFTASRPLIGGAAALVAYALLAADVITVGPVSDGAALLVIAFAAGFSERLVTGAVESLSGREAERAAPSPPSTGRPP